VPAFAPSPAASLPAIDADELDRRIQAAVAAALAARDARGEHEGQRVEAVEAGSTR
jgi:hypothetical protein